jgi:phosphotransacetylase
MNSLTSKERVIAFIFHDFKIGNTIYKTLPRSANVIGISLGPMLQNRPNRCSGSYPLSLNTCATSG